MQSTKAWEQLLTTTAAGPYVSLYLPLSENRDMAAHQLELRHLIHHAQAVMAEVYPECDWLPYAEQLAQLADTPQRTLGQTATGLGVICTPATLTTFELQIPVTTTAMVAAQPQILPLIADAKSRQELDVLVLQSDKITLLHTDHHTLTPIDLPADAPQTLTGTLGTQVRGGGINSISRGPGQVGYHGHGDKANADAVDMRRFFQAVDDYIMTHYSQPHQQALALWGAPQTLSAFRAISHNPWLIDAQLELNPEPLDSAACARAAVALHQDLATIHQHQLLAMIDQARSAKRLSRDLGTIIHASQAHAIEHLLIADTQRIHGTIVAGALETASAEAKHNNVLNDLAIITLQQGGQVTILPTAQLSAPVVAITRYQL